MNAVVKQPADLVALSRSQIDALERAMKELPESAKRPMENQHDFAPGIYARTIFMRAGVVYTSRIHKTKHFFVVADGACTVVDSHGERKLIVAPYLGMTEPGTKRAIHVHVDTVWTTFHATDLTDPEEIGKLIMAETYDEVPDPAVTP